MINPVNAAPSAVNVNTNLLSKVKADKQQPENNSIDTAQASGAEAMAAYNKAAVKSPVKADIKDFETLKNLKPSLPTVLQPEAIKILDGERIRNADGTLYAIVKKTPETTTTYLMDVQAPEDAIRKIITVDSKTGKRIRVQENYNKIEQGKLPVIFSTEITEFYPNSDDIKKLTTTINGKLDIVEESIYEKDGYKKHFINDGGELMICEQIPKDGVTKLTRYDNDGKISSVETSKKAEYYTETVKYRDGKPAETITEIKKPTENKTGKDPLHDPDLTPAPKYEINGDPKTFEGEKTTYSNGMLEALKVKNNNGGEVIYMFDIEGDLVSVDDSSDLNNKKIVMYHKQPECSDRTGYYTIEEPLGNDITKQTTYRDDGSVDVKVTDDKNDFEKYAQYTKDGYMEMYIENGTKDDALRMMFDKDGNLLE